MTRLENQIAEMENKVANYKKFAADKLAIFEENLPMVKKILKSYKIEVVSTDNKMIDEGIISKDLLLHIWIQTSPINLSDRVKSNLEKKLRNYLPLQLCPFRNESISIIYHE
jgi:hypothetical protein